MTLRSDKADNDHIPCVLVINSSGKVSQEHWTSLIANGKEKCGV